MVVTQALKSNDHLLRRRFSNMAAEKLENGTELLQENFDFFWWGYVKSLVYADKQATLHDLQTNIERVIADIPPELREKVMENWIQRIRLRQLFQGGHLSDTAFHK